MAYTTPPTFVDATELAADDLNTLGDDIVYLKAVSDARVFTGALATCGTQSIGDNSLTAVTFTVETFDVGGWIAVSSTTFTVPASAIPPGYTTVVVDVRVAIDFTSNSTGRRQFVAYQNGSVILSEGGGADPASNDHENGSVLTPAAVGDTFTLDVFQNSGGSLNLAGASMSVTVYAPLS